MIEHTTGSDVPPLPVAMNITVADLDRMDGDDIGGWTVARSQHLLSRCRLGADRPWIADDDSTVARETTDWFDTAVNRLHDLLRLPHSWDGRGSPAPMDSIVCAAERVLLQARDVAPANLPAPFACPVAGGGVQLEWTSDEKHFEIEFLNETELVFLAEDISRRGAKDAVEAGELDVTEGLAPVWAKLVWFARPNGRPDDVPAR